jgi:hypothetical protein
VNERDECFSAVTFAEGNNGLEKEIIFKAYIAVGGMKMEDWWKQSKQDLKPENPKSNWVTGKDGKEDAIPRQYLGAKTDAQLDHKRKHPWEN